MGRRLSISFITMSLFSSIRARTGAICSPAQPGGEIGKRVIQGSHTIMEAEPVVEEPPYHLSRFALEYLHLSWSIRLFQEGQGQSLNVLAMFCSVRSSKPTISAMPRTKRKQQRSLATRSQELFMNIQTRDSAPAAAGRGSVTPKTWASFRTATVRSREKLRGQSLRRVFCRWGERVPKARMPRCSVQIFREIQPWGAATPLWCYGWVLNPIPGRYTPS